MVVEKSMKISIKTKKRLDEFKIHKRESYDDAIVRALDSSKTILPEEDLNRDRD